MTEHHHTHDTGKLTVRDLVKGYPATGLGRKKIPVLQGLSFDLLPGEILGITGPSGMGKTTLARLLLRVTAADSGKIRFDGNNVLTLKGKNLAAYRQRVKAITQHPESALNPRFTIAESLREVFRPQGKKALAQATPETLRRMLDDVGLQAACLTRLPRQLSGGELQRVVIARTMATRPALIIADEPTSNLDVITRARMADLLTAQCRKHGAGMLLISHDTALVSALCHRVITLPKSPQKPASGGKVRAP